MKKTVLLAAAMMLCVVSGMAQKKVSILGDSYSTYAEKIPAGYAVFYPHEQVDVTDVSQTWWMQFINSNGYALEQNNSWSGSTICTTGYAGMEASFNSFCSRLLMLGNPDIIFIFGGTNDAWANVPSGEYQYEGWSKESLKGFRPATAYMLSQLKMLYPKAEIYFLLNSELREEINESSKTICEKLGVPLIELHDIEKQIGHPSVKGMKAISDQINEFIAKQK